MKAPCIKVKPPGPKAQAIIEKDRSYTAPAYGRVYPLVVKEGRGMVIEDVDGNLFLDFMAGEGMATTGHAPPKEGQDTEGQARAILSHLPCGRFSEATGALAQKIDHHRTRG